MCVNRCLKSHKILKNRIERRLGVPPHYLLDDLNNRPKQMNLFSSAGTFLFRLGLFYPLYTNKDFLKLLCLSKKHFFLRLVLKRDTEVIFTVSMFVCDNTMSQICYVQFNTLHQ